MAAGTDQVSGERHRRHHLTSDGFYKGKQVIDRVKPEPEQPAQEGEPGQS